MLTRARAYAVCGGVVRLCVMVPEPSDSHVGEHLFKEAICGALKGQTRVLVTHQLQFLPFVDRVIVVGTGGKVVCQGSYLQLMSQGVVFTSLSSSSSSSSSSESTGVDDTAVVEASEEVKQPAGTTGVLTSLLVPPEMKRGRSVEVVITPPVTPELSPTPMSISSDHSHAPVLALDKVMEDEERYVGVVGSSVYRAYLRAVGTPMFFVVLALLCVSLEVCKTSTLVWLTTWTDDADPDNARYLGVYLALAVATALQALARNFMWFYGCYRASRYFHEAMVSRVLKAPMSWFNSTPQGQIMNRFSKDVGVIDLDLPDAMNDCLLCCFEVCCAMITMAIVSPLMLVFIPVLMLVYGRLAQVHLTLHVVLAVTILRVYLFSTCGHSHMCGISVMNCRGCSITGAPAES